MKLLVFLVALQALPGHLNAQSAQRFSAQLSALATSIRAGGGSGISGYGFEPQIRLNRIAASAGSGALSLGVGGQWSQHTGGTDEITISGAFLEPRWVPPFAFSERVFPYLSARLAMLRQTNNFGTSSSGSAFGGGGGVAIAMTPRLNLDAGFALVRQQFGDIVLPNNQIASFSSLTTYAAKIGFSFGIGS